MRACLSAAQRIIKKLLACDQSTKEIFLQQDPPYTDQELLLLVAQGDQAGFKMLHDKYWDDIYPVALGLLKSPDLAMDALQEVFIRLWDRRNELPDIASFRSFLFISVRNEIISQLRKAKRRQHYHTDYGQQVHRYFADADARIRTTDTAKILHDAIQQLPDMQRKVLELSRQHGLNHQEIATELGIDKKAVTNAITRALNNIRGHLKVYGDDILLGVLILFAATFL